MDWTPQEILYRELTILVIDLRNSSEFFRKSELPQTEHPESARDHVREFVKELSLVTRTAVSDWSDRRNAEASIVKFTGDGFLILLAAPDDAPGSPLGPGRAAAIASRIRRAMRGICDKWNTLKDRPVAALDVGTVSSIVHGTVRYGKVAIPALEMHDALGESVVKAFRFSQLRAIGGSDGTQDLLVICTETEQHMQRLLETPSADEHQRQLSRQLQRLSFQKVLPEDLPDSKATKGVDDATLWVHVWQNAAVPVS